MKAALLAIALGLLSGRPDEPPAPLRLDQIQVIGTHNSYHLAPEPEAMAVLRGLAGDVVDAWDYSHRPLGEQLERLGIRQIELDVFADPEGGRYARPRLRTLLKSLGKDAGPDPDADGSLSAPGMKVLHVQDLDYRSTVPTLKQALREVRDWSVRNPSHVPVLILLELKEEGRPGLTPPLPFDRQRLEDLEAEILSVFERRHLLTPDDVRGDAESLREAVDGRGWPALDAVRGRVILALDNENEVRERYLEGHPALRGRLLFVSVGPDHPAAAWMKVNDPQSQGERIRDLVQRGFLVRTRADADTKQARTGDETRREAALASGAQYVSTDYPEPDARWSAYQVALPGGVVARANPVSAPAGAPAGDLESALNPK